MSGNVLLHIPGGCRHLYMLQMAAKSVEDRPVASLTRALAVVIQRLNVDGLLLPRTATHDGGQSSSSNDGTSGHCSISVSRRGGRQPTATGPGRVEDGSSVGEALWPHGGYHGERMRSISMSDPSTSAAAREKKPCSSGQGSGEQKKIVVNGYRVKETVTSGEALSPSVATTQPKDQSTLHTHSQLCKSTVSDSKERLIHSEKTEKLKSAAANDRISKGKHTKRGVTTTHRMQPVRVRSPPITRQAYVANRVGKRRGRLSGAGTRTWKPSVEHAKPVLKTKRKRVVCSSEFIDSSEVSDMEGEVSSKKCAKPSKTKRRKLISSGEEVRTYTEIACAHVCISVLFL